MSYNKKMSKRVSIILSAMLMAMSLSACNNAKQESDVIMQDALNENLSTEAMSETDVEILSMTGEKTTSTSMSETVQDKETVDNGVASTDIQENKKDADYIVELPKWDERYIPDNEALNFVEDMGLIWNLGNSLEAKDCDYLADKMLYETGWGNPYVTRELVQTVADVGFKTIRIPVSWHNHIDENWQIDKEWLDRVQEIVDWALEEDMYVIINIHHDDGKEYVYTSYACVEQSQKYVKAIWSQLSQRFVNYDERLIFEVLNEPRQIGASNEWWIEEETELGKECIESLNQINQTAVDTIRENGGNNASRYIMVPGYCASPNYVLDDNFKLPQDSADNRLLVSVHAYTPYNFALADTIESTATDYFSMENGASISEIHSFMAGLYDKYVSQGIGVVIGEFGARDRDGNVESRMEYTAYYTARARYNGMTVGWWDNNIFEGNGQRFGLIDRSDNQVKYKGILANLLHYSKRENLPVDES